MTARLWGLPILVLIAACATLPPTKAHCENEARRTFEECSESAMPLGMWNAPTDREQRNPNDQRDAVPVSRHDCQASYARQLETCRDLPSGTPQP